MDITLLNDLSSVDLKKVLINPTIYNIAKNVTIAECVQEGLEFKESELIYEEMFKNEFIEEIKKDTKLHDELIKYYKENNLKLNSIRGYYKDKNDSIFFSHKKVLPFEKEDLLRQLFPEAIINNKDFDDPKIKNELIIVYKNHADKSIIYKMLSSNTKTFRKNVDTILSTLDNKDFKDKLEITSMHTYDTITTITINNKINDVDVEEDFQEFIKNIENLTK